MMRASPERPKPSTSSATNCVVSASNAPATPASPAADRVGGEPPAEHRRADRVHARFALADAGERSAEGRVHDAPHDKPGEEQHGEAVEIGGAVDRCRTRKRPSTGHTVMPCSPSAPPVMAVALFAASWSMKAMTSVSMSKVRPRARSMMAPLAEPEQCRDQRHRPQGRSTARPSHAPRAGPRHRRRRRRTPHGPR